MINLQNENAHLKKKLSVLEQNLNEVLSILKTKANYANNNNSWSNTNSILKDPVFKPSFAGVISNNSSKISNGANSSLVNTPNNNKRKIIIDLFYYWTIEKTYII